MFFLPTDLDDYIVAHTQDEPQILKDLTRETHQKVLQAIMLSGAYQGRVLSMISHLKAPMRVLELGTFTGYSALCIAEGMPAGSELITIDINEELEDLAGRYFTRFCESANHNITITQKVGPALDIIPTLEGKFDMIFIDADKPNYINYFHAIMEKVNPGALILSDNVLWHGKVVETVNPKDNSTPILLEFNQLLKEDPRLQTVLFSIRDGLTLSRVL
ncbi:O-methyltransferase [Nonlabens ulvanivorans]|uniref:O-methyltransferase n=1 Tax=Nonlabens ulvanivorans TaxID=906888 RepID=A0A090QAB6_NONUL|nr:class I SAM-dependent methyltransferase [Nonlabens ulvanivorans]GAK99177.1 O-methyltransferase [Nonlabens ulvanivorans]GAL75209.1 O-methyltransferase [Nonlabens ulvanivorans]